MGWGGVGVGGGQKSVKKCHVLYLNGPKDPYSLKPKTNSPSLVINLITFLHVFFLMAFKSIIKFIYKVAIIIVSRQIDMLFRNSELSSL